MSKLDLSRLNPWEERVYIETRRHFAAALKQPPVDPRDVKRLARSLSVLALAANMAAAKPTGDVIEMNDGTKWYRGIELMNHVSLCHRPLLDGMEYAVVEYFPAPATHEIWNRGWNAMEVLRMFTQERQQAWKTWADNLAGQIKEFLSAKYPRQNINRLADDFIHRSFLQK